MKNDTLLPIIVEEYKTIIFSTFKTSCTIQIKNLMANQINSFPLIPKSKHIPVRSICYSSFGTYLKNVGLQQNILLYLSLMKTCKNDCNVVSVISSLMPFDFLDAITTNILKYHRHTFKVLNINHVILIIFYLYLSQIYETITGFSTKY